MAMFIREYRYCLPQAQRSKGILAYINGIVESVISKYVIDEWCSPDKIKLIPQGRDGSIIKVTPSFEHGIQVDFNNKNQIEEVARMKNLLMQNANGEVAERLKALVC